MDNTSNNNMNKCLVKLDPNTFQWLAVSCDWDEEKMSSLVQELVMEALQEFIAKNIEG